MKCVAILLLFFITNFNLICSTNDGGHNSSRKHPDEASSSSGVHQTENFNIQPEPAVLSEGAAILGKRKRTDEPQLKLMLRKKAIKKMRLSKLSKIHIPSNGKYFSVRFEPLKNHLQVDVLVIAAFEEYAEKYFDIFNQQKAIKREYGGIFDHLLSLDYALPNGKRLKKVPRRILAKSAVFLLDELEGFGKLMETVPSDLDPFIPDPEDMILESHGDEYANFVKALKNWPESLLKEYMPNKKAAFEIFHSEKTSLIRRELSTILAAYYERGDRLRAALKDWAAFLCGKEEWEESKNDAKMMANWREQMMGIRRARILFDTILVKANAIEAVLQTTAGILAEEAADTFLLKEQAMYLYRNAKQLHQVAVEASKLLEYFGQRHNLRYASRLEIGQERNRKNLLNAELAYENAVEALMTNPDGELDLEGLANGEVGAYQLLMGRQYDGTKLATVFERALLEDMAKMEMLMYAAGHAGGADENEEEE